MFEKTSSEISDNVFIGLVAGVVVVSVVVIVGGIAYLAGPSNNKHENKTVITNQEKIPTYVNTSRTAENLERLGSQIAANTEEVLERENLLKELRYAAVQDSNKYYEYDSLKKALDKLKLLKENTQSIQTLKIGFPSKLILDYKTKEEYHLWLARLADYIFVSRFLLIEDTTQVVRNKEFKRVGPNKITKRGNIIFSEDKDFWWVEIRGLTSFVDEMQAVANYVEQAIKAPKTMSPCAEFAVQDLSTRISAFLEKNKRDALKKGIPELIDKFVGFCSENSKGFLTQVDFTKAENITDIQCKNLITETLNFTNEFNKKIIPVIHKFSSDTECRNTNYKTTIILLKDWVQKTELSEILKQSLFIK